MRILITGATSIIGVPLIKQLLLAEHEIIAVVRPHSTNLNKLRDILDAPGVRILRMDLKNAEKMSDWLPHDFDICFHFGWDGAGSDNRKNREIQQGNVTTSMYVFKAAIKLGCKKFIFSGSQAEYGLHNEQIDENTQCSPVSEYGKAKLDFMNQAKRYLSENGSDEAIKMQYIHTRIFSVYGPEDHAGSLVESCVRTFLEGGEIALGDCSQLWNFLYIDDLSEAFITLMNMENHNVPFEIYNIAGSESETMRLKDYIEIMHKACGNKGRYVLGVRRPNAEGTANLNPNINKIRGITGWNQKVSFDEGIRKVIRSRRVENA